MRLSPFMTEVLSFHQSVRDDLEVASDVAYESVVSEPQEGACVQKELEARVKHICSRESKVGFGSGCAHVAITVRKVNHTCLLLERLNLQASVKSQAMEEGTRTKKTIFVGGISDNVDESVIYDNFSTFGVF